MKFSIKNDYYEGCHPQILESLVQNNLDQQPGYGEDKYSLEAKKMLREKIENPDSEIYFVSGGTQANLIVISSILRPYQCVISANAGHIMNNETGAIESTGHKILGIENNEGKLFPNDIIPVLESHKNIPHQVMPKLVYISNSTELGTIYTKEELTNLSKFCKENNLYLFMDGARLGRILISEYLDNTMIFVEVEDTDKFWNDLVSLNLTEKYSGVKLTPVRMMDWGKECFVHDPSGILWHFGEFFSS